MDKTISKTINSKWNKFWPYLGSSIWLGARMGFALSSFYIIYIILSNTIVYTFIDTYGFAGSLFAGRLFIQTGIVYGVLPSTVFGAISAALIFGILWLRKNNLTSRLAISTGFAIPFVISFPTQFIVSIAQLSFSYGPSWISLDRLWVGQPMFIYILGGGLVGWLISKSLSAGSIDNKN